jgi:hypothetical protein
MPRRQAAKAKYIKKCQLDRQDAECSRFIYRAVAAAPNSTKRVIAKDRLGLQITPPI